MKYLSERIYKMLLKLWTKSQFSLYFIFNNWESVDVLREQQL